jgi:hypothetical protein
VVTAVFVWARGSMWVRLDDVMSISRSEGVCAWVLACFETFWHVYVIVVFNRKYVKPLCKMMMFVIDERPAILAAQRLSPGISVSFSASSPLT